MQLIIYGVKFADYFILADDGWLWTGICSHFPNSQQKAYLV
jgi:hypothetical protein